MLAPGGEHSRTEDRNIYTSVPSLQLPSTGANYTVRRERVFQDCGQVGFFQILTVLRIMMFIFNCLFETT